MKSSYSTLIQSKFFHPSFNSAIFDGPLRIYFSQVHESLALKIYFGLQSQHPAIVAQAKESHRRHGHNVLVLLYPTAATLGSIVPSAVGQDFVLEDIQDDAIVAVGGPIADQAFSGLLVAIASCLEEESEAHAPISEALRPVEAST